jgi:hypothetical protein
MTATGRPDTPPPSRGGDGVRITPLARTPRGSARWVFVTVLALVALIAGAYFFLPRPAPPAAPVAGVAEPVPLPARARNGQRASPTAVVQAARDLPTDDPNDLANYFAPGDPEPTGAELIGALHDVGIRTGLGAFDPPGTSPPLEGLAVPEDFELPPGYARHHQFTDEGVAIEPILMFSPDFVLYDAQGRPLPMPLDRVVPPELAPPGLPLRRVRIPPGG